MQTDEGGVNTQYKSKKNQKMGTYAVNIYGWLMCTATNNRKQNEHAIHIQDHLYIEKSIYRLEDFEGVTKE